MDTPPTGFNLVADIFRIETEQSHLSWTGKLPDSAQPEGRLAISFPGHAATHVRIERYGVPTEVATDLEIEVGPRLSEETAYKLLLRSTGKQQIELRHRDP